jgi:putative membrane protein
VAGRNGSGNCLHRLETFGGRPGPISEDGSIKMMGGYGGSFGFGLGGVFMIVWWVLVIVGMAMLVKWVLNSSGTEDPRQTGGKALDILKERYARGEIDAQEFQKKKHDLTQ